MRFTYKAIGLLILLALASCAETREDSFPSMSTPGAQSMMTRGWIPTVLPSTATDVRLRSNIDTNMVRGTARLPAADLQRLRGALRPLADDAVPPFRTNVGVTPKWWPPDLRPPSRTAELRGRGWELFSVPEESAAYIALHASEGRVYFWSESD